MSYNYHGLHYELCVAEVNRFIKDHHSLFDGKLSNFYNYSRVVSLAEFGRLIKELKLQNQQHIGVVSGSMNEPELKLIDAEQISLLNFSEDASYDLDMPWKLQPSRNFSLTICNQVFEHIFNQHIALENLIHHTRKDGHIYISIPTVNCIHGEPYFYSAGFHPRFLERLALEHNLEILNIGFWGSHKYLINAVSGQWLTNNQLKKGVHRLRDLRYPISIFQDGRFRSKNNRYITDCWGLFKKK